MIDPSFLLKYSLEGDTYLKSTYFYNHYDIKSYQAVADRSYFYGVLITINRKGGNGIKNVHRYAGTKDGFRAWKDILNDCDSEGSDTFCMTNLK